MPTQRHSWRHSTLPQQAHSHPVTPPAGVIDADSASLLASLDTGITATRGWGVCVAPGRRAAPGGAAAAPGDATTSPGDAVGDGEGLTVVVAGGGPTKAQGIMMLQVCGRLPPLAQVCFEQFIVLNMQ